MRNRNNTLEKMHTYVREDAINKIIRVSVTSTTSSNGLLSVNKTVDGRFLLFLVSFSKVFVFLCHSVYSGTF